MRKKQYEGKIRSLLLEEQRLKNKLLELDIREMKNKLLEK